MQRLLLLSLLFLVIACKKESGDDTNAEQSYIDVSYGTHSLQKMDLYLPANRDTTGTKLMILIHGGAWIEGDKADLTTSINDIKKLLPGYAFANINYRLYNGQNKFPAQENDVEAAVSFLLSKRAEYKYSDKVILLGASAGAHLALLQGYKHTNLITPKAIVSYFGPTDLTYLYNHPAQPVVPAMLTNIIGFTPTQNASIYTNSSPINFVTGKSAPTILLQGDADILVPVEQVYLLKDKLKAAGVTNQVVVYPGEQHGFTPTTMDDSIKKIISFLMANVP
ncbi:MAG TPA: alpha/beta hydrolase [Niastella sp.]